jgi:hypothetical protein
VPPKLWEFQFWKFRNSHLRILKQNDIWVLALMARHRKYYKGEGDGFPQISGCDESYESVIARVLSVHQKCCNYALTNLLFSLCRSMWTIELLVTIPSPILELQHTPLPLKCYKPGMHPNSFSFLCLHLLIRNESIKELSGASQTPKWKYQK